MSPQRDMTMHADFSCTLITITDAEEPIHNPAAGELRPDGRADVFDVFAGLGQIDQAAR